MELNIQSASNGGGGSHRRRRRPSTRRVQRKIARIADQHELNTQRVRFELIFELKALEEMAQQIAIDTIQPDCKRDWMRAAAYIGQVINSISKAYDEASVDADLARLRQKIEELSEKKQEGAAEA